VAQEGHGPARHIWLAALRARWPQAAEQVYHSQPEITPGAEDEQAALDLDRAVQAAGRELSEAMALKCGELADRVLGRPELGTPEWVEEHAARDTDAGRQRLQDWHLVKARIYTAAGIDPTGDVLNARKAGATWDAIGDACDMTGQSAHDCWAQYEDRLSRKA
jgi:hypothetical protein